MNHQFYVAGCFFWRFTKLRIAGVKWPDPNSPQLDSKSFPRLAIPVTTGLSQQKGRDNLHSRTLLLRVCTTNAGREKLMAKIMRAKGLGQFCLGVCSDAVV